MTTEMDMVERVALAIWQARERRLGIDRTTRMEPDALDRASGAWAATMAEARAAIEAMREPTEAMVEALVDPDSPFIGRRTIDKRCGEVVEQTNADWRNTIGTDADFRHHGHFADEREAAQMADRLGTKWRFSNAIDAALTPSQSSKSPAP